MAVEFNTTDYVFSHGHTPRGRGSWAFFPTSACRIEDAIWSPSMTYTEAKRWVKQHPNVVSGSAARGGSIEIFVGS